MYFSEKAVATRSSTLAWKISWTEEPGRLQSMGSRRVGHDWATSLSLSCIGEGSGNLLQCSCLENPRDGGAWWAAVYGVAQSQTRLKRLGGSSSMIYKGSLVKAFALNSDIPLVYWSQNRKSEFSVMIIFLFYSHKSISLLMLIIQALGSFSVCLIQCCNLILRRVYGTK